MKKNFLASFCGCIVSLLLLSNSFAQTNPSPATTAFTSVDRGRIGSKPAALGKPTTSVPAKALLSFQQSFKNTTPVWYTSGRKYVARFIMEGRPGHAVYERNGFMVYSVCKGAEKDLPAAVRRLIKSNYVDYAIATITEAHSGNYTAWIVDLLDDKSLVIVKVMDMEMEELARYQKCSTVQ